MGTTFSLRAAVKIIPVTWGWTQVKTGALHVSGYGVEACDWPGVPEKGWACAPDAQWFNMDAHPECMGEFVWTGWATARGKLRLCPASACQTGLPWSSPPA